MITKMVPYILIKVKDFLHPESTTGIGALKQSWRSIWLSFLKRNSFWVEKCI